MTNLHDALEVCLQAITDGQSPETALSFYPELRAELEPLLRAVQAARGPAYADFPEEVRRRGRSRFLQRAAQIREGRAAPSSRPISFLPRTAITLAVVVVLVLSSTGLVSASSGALPGDQLYGVKRSWEDLRLLLVVQPQQRYLLESEFDQERLNEIGGLLARRRAESISFAGLVMRKNDGTWVVSGSLSLLPAPPGCHRTSWQPAHPCRLRVSLAATGLWRPGKLRSCSQGWHCLLWSPPMTERKRAKRAMPAPLPRRAQ
jgi:hypothetical protein